jgi:hypothetical protein
MSRDMTVEKAVSVIKNGFLPLECVVEVFDDGNKARFRVYNQDGRSVLSVSEVLVRRLQARYGIRGIIGKCRSRLRIRGYQLLDWHPPI